MPTNEEIKSYLDGLSPEELKVAEDHLDSLTWTWEKLSAEKLELLQSLPTPITDSDKAFIKKNKHNNAIQRDKIKFTETTIELDGLKFPRTIAKYDDVKNTPWLELDTNVYQKDGNDYFTFDAVEALQSSKKYKDKIPSKYQWQQTADVFGWDYGILGQLLNYPKAGVRRSIGERVGVGTTSVLWSSTLHADDIAYGVWFSVDGVGTQDWINQSTARSLVFLQG
jgi:hypothetical protein